MRLLTLLPCLALLACTSPAATEAATPAAPDGSGPPDAPPPESAPPDAAPPLPPTDAAADSPDAAPTSLDAAPPTDSSPKLAWAPPPLVNPVTIQLGAGPTHTDLDPGTDYVVELPAQKKIGNTTLSGGHNVVVIGGYVSVPGDAGAPNSNDIRNIFIQNATGTVHIEGVLIDSSEGGETDAIEIQAPEAVVQVENVRVEGLLGSQSGNHSDIIQPWGGVKELRVDRLTGSSDYQGYFVPADLGPIGRVTIEHSNLVALSNPTGTGGYLLWWNDPPSYPATLCSVFIQPAPGRDLASSVWPQPPSTPNDEASWAGVTGFVQGGAPSGGDFVPAGVAGLGYASPGYLPDADAGCP